MDMQVNSGYEYPKPQYAQISEAPTKASSWSRFFPQNWFSPWRWLRQRYRSSKNSSTRDKQSNTVSKSNTAEEYRTPTASQYTQISKTPVEMPYEDKYSSASAEPFAIDAEARFGFIPDYHLDSRLAAYREELLSKVSSNKIPTLEKIFALYEPNSWRSYVIHDILNDWVSRSLIIELRDALSKCRQLWTREQGIEKLKNLLVSIDKLLSKAQSGGNKFARFLDTQFYQDLNTIVTRSRLLSYFEIFMQTDGVDLEHFFNSIFDLWEDLRSPQMKRLISHILDMGNSAHRSINPVRNSQDLSTIYRYRTPN